MGVDDFRLRMRAEAPETDEPFPTTLGRFRPNIVVRTAGLRPYAEDDWQDIRVGDCLMQVVKPCSRCIMPTISQVDAATRKEVTSTLRKYRMGKHIAGWGKHALYRESKNDSFFAQNLLVRSGGVLQIGDECLIR